MSETKQRNFLQGCWVTEKKFDNGGSILRLRVLPEKLAASLETLKVDDQGFATVVLAKSKSPKPGNEYYLYEDDWQPSQPKTSLAPRPVVKVPAKSKKVVEKVEAEEELI